ncbi:nucleolar protein 58-like [Pollicipes pollicipes]|uniref:nucleolar protein 58-like n=1 Tax=Pollicipes pollicipes TaxID=41117 RepID=UPI001884D669|nr:nucleolar protein 58-like [Pollicipes pollicipes]
MLVLFETAAGFALFKLLDEKKLKSTENLFEDFETPEKAGKIVKLKHFQKFADTTEALAAITGVIEGKMSKPLKKLLKKVDVQEELALSDAKLGNLIKEKLDVQCVASSKVNELIRCIRSQADSLITGLSAKDATAMRLGLAHSLSRYKLKFSPDKVDTMIVQAVCLLDELDKELNNYVMRCREWYGWHFPELSKIITDNIAFVKAVTKMGMRTNALETDFSDILPEEVEASVRKAAEISMGTEISESDIENIRHLCEQILEITEYRAQLSEYLKNRMAAVAPNLSVLVGDIVGARLISHAGSLMNLAKHPASTVQILGAEKALFRALKTKHDTPKYGLIYHAQFVTHASSKLKGKASRMLATKAALACRVDALGEDANANSELGVEHRARLEARLRALEEGGSTRISGSGRKAAKFDSYQNTSEIRQYSAAADSTIPSSVKRKMADGEEGFPKRPKSDSSVKTEPEDMDGSYAEASSEKKKKKKKKHMEAGGDAAASSDTPVKTEDSDEDAAPKKKKKKRLSEAAGDASMNLTEEEVATPSEGKKKKKKKSKSESNDGDMADLDTTQEMEPEVSSEKKKKKKKAK